LGRWQARRDAGQLADRAPGGHPLHGLLEAERAAIVALFEAWGEIDRSHCKLAHRGSRLQLVHVSHQGWIETLFGHVKGEWPHLEKISDPGELERELDLRRVEYNSVRLHAGVGYVTPDDEHTGRGEAIRKAREAGLETARLNRLARHRTERDDQTNRGPADVV
jgi:hypothetical protein